ncbi:MAG: hypothetical protein RL745_681 [Actinomycetota bacterium]|jgi:3-dehydroquinate dehydratase-2
MKVRVLNGPNLSQLGSREPDVYGTVSYSELEQLCLDLGRSVGLDVEVSQSEDESDLVAWVHEAARLGEALIINPAAFTHYSYALRDACAMHPGPIIEVHLTNPSAREEFRRTSVISPVASGVISGFGVFSYVLAFQALASMGHGEVPADGGM